ncbi:MAG: trypsin-like peptidase domain-containing protein [Acidimicrobiales bacterium]|nr:trypsin-like peptidase domain-containing protein [Acidimicrobiales bacterium]
MTWGLACLASVASLCGLAFWVAARASPENQTAGTVRIEAVTEVGPPPGEHGLPGILVERLLASTVGIRGLDCRKAQVGSGFLVEGGLVVTSAHVVAGIALPVVSIGAEKVAARVIGFDPVADLAVLEPVGSYLLPPPLALGDPVVGTVGAILVHDDAGPRAIPVKVTQRIRATGTDVYGDPAGGRDALVLAAKVETGHSGSAVVDGQGLVVGVTFSRSRGEPRVAYAVQSGSIEKLLKQVKARPEAAGPCID